MEYRGVRYEIKISPGPNEWIWIVHTPSLKKGSLRGLRARAIDAAITAIEKHCREHPADCNATAELG